MGLMSGRTVGASAAAIACVLVGGLTFGAVGAGATPPAGSIVTNGSFESPAVTSYMIPSSIPGWTATNNCGVEVDPSGTFGTAFDGNQSVELNSNCVAGIRQTIATTPGVSYQLAFAFGGRPGTMPAQNQMSVIFGASPVVTVGPITPSGSNINWTYYQYTVTATSTSTTLAFQSSTPFQTSEGGELDDVSLVPLPDNDLALQNVPANITTQGTGPSGAVVTYTPPTATDEGGESPAVNCLPASGSTFAIGNTTVTCTATDADDANSPVSATFTVDVTAAPTHLTAYPQLVALPPGGIGLFTVGATLTSGGVPLAGEPIVFSVGGTFLCSAVTSPSGTASCGIGLFQELDVVLSAYYTASFAGDGDFLGSTGSTFTLELFGDEPFVRTHSAAITGGTVTRAGEAYVRISSARQHDGTPKLSVHRLRPLTAGRYVLTLKLSGRTERQVKKTITLK